MKNIENPDQFMYGLPYCVYLKKNSFNLVNCKFEINQSITENQFAGYPCKCTL